MWFAIWAVCSIFREVVFRIRSLYQEINWWTTFFTEKVLPKKKSVVNYPVGLDVNSIKAMVYFKICFWLYGSVQFSHTLVSNSLWPPESQHARPPCPSPTPRVHSNSGPSSQWCHPAISSSVVPFSSCPQSLPASESFPISQLFAWGGQSIGVSASASVLPMNTQDWCPLGWTGERLLLNHAKMPGFLASRGEEFNPGPEMRLDRSVFV